MGGAAGALCASPCAPEDQPHRCPRDVPTGTLAVPQCQLEDPVSGRDYCVLVCTKDEECPDGAKCPIVETFVGVCIYPDSNGGVAPSQKLVETGLLFRSDTRSGNGAPDLAVIQV